MAVARDESGRLTGQWRDDSGDVTLLRELLNKIGDRRANGRGGDGRRGGLHQHALARRKLEVGLVENLCGPSRLTVGDGPALHLLDADRVAGDDRQEREREPTKGGRLPMRRAPPAGAAGEVRA